MIELTLFELFSLGVVVATIAAAVTALLSGVVKLFRSEELRYIESVMVIFTAVVVILVGVILFAEALATGLQTLIEVLEVLA